MTNTPSVAESVLAALRRSRWILIAAVIVGVATVNLAVWNRGERFEANAKILLADDNLASQISGAGGGFVDPERSKATDLALGVGSQVYRDAAEQLYDDPALAGDVRKTTSVSGSSADDVVRISATDSTDPGAVGKVNAVASAYTRWRGEVAAEPLVKARELIEAQIADGAASAELTDRLTTVRVLESLARNNARVVEPATTATQTSPKPVRDTALGFGVGLIAGLGIILLSEWLNVRVRSENDVEEALNLRVIASLPRMPKGPAVLLGPRRPDYQENFLILAADLERRVNSVGGDGRVLAVTSSLKGEGKTSTACNLAIALAYRGEKVLLADCDWRSPAVSRLMDIGSEAAPGIRDVVGRRATVQGAIRTISLAAQPTRSALPDFPVTAADPGPSLAVLTAGTQGFGGGDDRALTSRQLAPFFAEVRPEFDWIVLDTAPALLVADTAQVSALVDGMLIVVRLGSTRRRDLRHLERQVANWPLRPTGAVLTFSPRPKTAAYGYTS